MCEKAIEKKSTHAVHVADHFKTQEMCDKTVRDDPFSLIYVPDWFVTQQVKIWHDDSEYHDNDRIVEWYDGYKKTQGMKNAGRERVNVYYLASIKMALLVHVRRRDKMRQKNYGGNI